VAEDNPVNQLVARGVLEGLGYVVEFADDGLEAVSAVTSAPGRFVAVLMDCQMPRLDGYEATRVIRNMEPTDTRVPVIAMTASGLSGERERCLEAGMDDFLVKPVDFEVLESTLARWIGGDPGSEATTTSEDTVSDASGVLDLDRVRMLHELRPGAESFFDQVSDSFRDRVGGDVDTIESAIREVDHSRLSMAAHALKGSAQNLGALEVGRACQALESAGDRRDVSEMEGLMSDLRLQVQLTLVALEKQTA
jgi:CheY-like chemotaxis protein